MRVEGGIETFIINYIKVHKKIMTGCKLKEQAVVARALMVKN